MEIAEIKGFDKLFPTLITLDIHEDDRGSFCELWRQTPQNIDFRPIQSNLSINKKRGTFRGLHFQTFLPQAKLVTVIQGRIIDFVVDVRQKSKTFGKFQLFWLRPGQSLLVPKGMAHGFLTLTSDTVVNYLVDGHRFPEHERIINPLDDKLTCTNDEELSMLEFIHYTMKEVLDLNLSDLVMSEKDRYSPALDEIDDVSLKFACVVGDER